MTMVQAITGQGGGSQQHERNDIPVGTVVEGIEVGPGALVELTPEIIQGHQKRRRKIVGLAFDLTVLGIPCRHILLAASKAVRIS